MSLSHKNIHHRGVNFQVHDTPFFQEFWNNFHKWEPDTFDIFDRFLNNQYSYLDIGAWIGPTVLYGVNRAKHVYAIEPDPIAYRELLKNIQLNPGISSNVTCISEALDDKRGNIKLFKRIEMGDSSSSIIPTSSDEYHIVTALTIEDLVLKYNFTDINFIKMDIEAGEYFLIPALNEYLKRIRPTLFLSIHPPFLQEALALQTIIKMKTKFDSYHSSQLNLTERLVENLDFYKFIYDIHGNLVSKDHILNLNDFGMYIFSDEKW